MINAIHTCRVCNVSGSFPTFIAREMMFGTRQEFEYFQCKACDCLQITNIPENLGTFYPFDYYSLSVPKSIVNSALRAFFIKQRFRFALYNRGQIIERLLWRFVERPNFKLDEVLPVIKVLQYAENKDYSARFLDIGCGSWSLWLDNLRDMGFKYLFGVDPFIDSEVNHNGIKIFKSQLSEVRGFFDFITLHHSLEHIPDQKAALVSAYQLLAPNGIILVRIPTVSSYVWRNYNTNWVELDAPRHLYLHSRKSILLLAEEVGLKLHFSICDSKSFEFFGSEQYLRGIPLTKLDLNGQRQFNITFSVSEMEAFKNQAQQVNENEEGGRLCLFFKKNETA